MADKPIVGHIEGQPHIGFTASSGRRWARTYVKTEEHGSVAAFGDPDDEQLFSFQDGDEVEVEIETKGDRSKAIIVTPRGTASASEQIKAAEERFAKTMKLQEGGISAIAGLYADCLSAVLNDDLMQENLKAFTTAQQAAIVQGAASSVFIQANRDGIYE